MDMSKRQITKIAREAHKLVVRTMKEGGIGSGEMDLIHMVRHNPGLSQREISLQLNMIRKENPADGRSQLLYATEKAENLKTSKAAVETVFYAWLLEGLDPAELASFTAVLDKLYLRSKQESRSVFPNVTKLLAEREEGGTHEQP